MTEERHLHMLFSQHMQVKATYLLQFIVIVSMISLRHMSNILSSGADAELVAQLKYCHQAMSV